MKFVFFCTYYLLCGVDEFSQTREMHFNCPHTLLQRNATCRNIMVVTKMRRRIAILRRRVNTSHVCMCLVCVKHWNVHVRLEPFSQISVLFFDTHMNDFVMYRGAVFLFIIPGVCSENMNGRRWRRIRDTIEQEKAHPGMDCISPMTELIKDNSDWLGST